MPDREFTLHFVIQALQNGTYRGSVLAFPELAALDDSVERIERQLTRDARALIPDLPTRHLSQCLLPAEVEVRDVQVELPPPLQHPA